MFYTFLTPSHSIGTVAMPFAGGMFGAGVEKSVKKLDKLDYSYIMVGKRQAASGKRQAASKAAMLKLKVFIL
jgi:hypothetical protein